MQHNQKKYFGGYYDDPENAAMGVNLLCDNLEIERKNPTINMKIDKVTMNNVISILKRGKKSIYSLHFIVRMIAKKFLFSGL